MPVILDKPSFEEWLDPGQEDTSKLQTLLVPAPVEAFEAYPVSRAVNNPIHDAPDCVERI
jgi:putative SOS response-associated peptidase YedK